MSAYIADQTWPEEAHRLSELERALDDGTCRYLARLGIREGMRCLEVGGGSGSIARWLAASVGPSGHVTVTDLDTSLLEKLAHEFPQVRVVREDISDGVRAVGRDFDLVHARLVLGHVRDPERALANIMEALRPGGVVLVEDADFLWTDVGQQPVSPASAAGLYFPVWQKVVEYMRTRGYAVHWGRELAAALLSAGFADVAGEAVMLIGNKALQASMALTLERFAPALVDEGMIAQSSARACIDTLRDPRVTFTGSPVFSVWGTKPHSSTP